MTVSSVERNPVTLRVPITQEFLVQEIAKGNSTHPAAAHFKEALYNSIVRLVYSLSKKYECTYKDGDVEDLTNYCFIRIFENLHQYDKSKALFTTWTWRVCSSVLARHYRKSLRNESFTSIDAVKDHSIEDDPSRNCLSGEIKDAVRHLFDEHVDKGLILAAMFGGHPDDADFALTDKICISEIARETGFEYNEVANFYKGVVKPFFVRRFGREIS